MHLGLWNNTTEINYVENSFAWQANYKKPFQPFDTIKAVAQYKSNHHKPTPLLVIKVDSTLATIFNLSYAAGVRVHHIILGSPPTLGWANFGTKTNSVGSGNTIGVANVLAVSYVGLTLPTNRELRHRSDSPAAREEVAALVLLWFLEIVGLEGFFVA